MRTNTRKLRLALGLTFCSLLLAASGIDGSSTAAAFGFGGGFGGGFGHMGGFGGPGRGFGGGPRAMAPGRGGGRIVDRPTGGYRGGTGLVGTGGLGIVGRGGHPVPDAPQLPARGGGLGIVGRSVGVGGNPVPEAPQLPMPGGGGGNNVAGGGGGGSNVAGGGGSSGVPPRGERRYVPDEIIIAFPPSATPQSIDQIAQRYNLTLLESQRFALTGSTFSRWRISGRRSVPDEVGTIEDDRTVASAQPNYIFSLQEDAAKKPSNAQGDTAQYVLNKLQIEQAHQFATGKNIAVAVIDSEIDVKHPELDATIAKSFDALGGDEKPHSHGTAMAGAIAAHLKLMGIAPGAQLLVAHAFDDAAEAKGTSFAIYKGLQWAADNDARVVNMSFAGPADPALHRLLAAAFEKGMVLIAAAGNAGPNSPPLYPAADPNVIAVTATDSKDGAFKMANRGPYVAVAAPGVEILALAPGEAYQVTTGTSVAAAHISGVAALLLECKPTLKPAEVRTILRTTAKPFEFAGHADFGAGLANAYQAVMSLNPKPLAKDDSEQAKQ
jgi:hypothetical protein